MAESQINTLDPRITESLVLKGDLSGLTPKQKVEYVIYRCHQMGLDPSAQPFELMSFQGKQVLYAKVAAADMLSRVNNLSVALISTEKIEDVLVVTARATSPDGRFTDNVGCLAIGAAKGEALQNALMKVRSKARRRAILSHCGLGMMDEDEAIDLEVMDAGQNAWNDADYANANQAMDALADDLIKSGMEESDAEAIRRTSKPAMSIGDPTIDYEKWNNRFLAYSERLQTKAKKSGPPELTGGGEVPEGPGVPPPEALPLTLSQIVGENWDKLRKKWAAEPGMEDTHLDRRIKARIKTWAGDLDSASVEWLEAVRAGQEEAMK